MKETELSNQGKETAEKESLEKKDPSNPHKGHRERMRARFRTSGLDGFAAHEIVEFLLFYTHARCNTNDIAHALIEKFGSLPGVLDASYEELIKVDKINEVSATMITFLPELFRRYCKDKEEAQETFNTITKLRQYGAALFVGATVEQLYLILLDNGMHILDSTLISYGTVNSVPVMTRGIAEKALEKHASYVVIAHNHPNGLPIPSKEDMEMTATIENALGLFEIPLLEHLLVAGNQCFPIMYQNRASRNELQKRASDQPFLRSFYEIADE